jgi:hypothetical protein
MQIVPPERCAPDHTPESDELLDRCLTRAPPIRPVLPHVRDVTLAYDQRRHGGPGRYSPRPVVSSSASGCLR